MYCFRKWLWIASIDLLGGAGGKGVWGKLGSELGAELDIPDRDDPNYDSDMYTVSIILHYNLFFTWIYFVHLIHNDMHVIQFVM